MAVAGSMWLLQGLLCCYGVYVAVMGLCGCYGSMWLQNDRSEYITFLPLLEQHFEVTVSKNKVLVASWIFFFALLCKELMESMEVHVCSCILLKQHTKIKYETSCTTL